MKSAITLGNKLPKENDTSPRERSLLLFFRRMDKMGCTEKILVGSILHQQDNSRYIPKIKNRKEPRKENDLFNFTKIIALILVTSGAYVSASGFWMLEFPLNPSSDTLEGLFQN